MLERRARTPIKKRYKIQQELANGFLGPTVLVEDKETKVAMICKVCEKAFIGGPEKLESFKNRIEILQQKNLPFVVPFTDIVESEDKLYLLRPFLNCPNLSESCQETRIQVGSSGMYEQWKKITKCVAAIHKEGIFPSSIKPNNIFVNNDGAILLTDLYELSSDITWALQTPDASQLAFLAPEFFTRAASPAAYSDVWSLGVILYFMVTGYLPYSTKNVFVMIKHISEREIPAAANFPIEALLPFRAIMSREVNERPPAENLSDASKLQMYRSNIRRSTDPIKSNPMHYRSRQSSNIHRATGNRLLIGHLSNSHRVINKPDTEVGMKAMSTSCFTIRCRVMNPCIKAREKPRSILSESKI